MSDSTNTVDTVTVIIGAVLLIAFLFLVFNTWIVPLIKKYMGTSEKPPPISTLFTTLCLYYQMVSGQVQTTLGGPDLVKFRDDYLLTPQQIAGNMSQCFVDEVPHGCMRPSPTGCADLYPWDGIVHLSERTTCPFNHEVDDGQLYGYVICAHPPCAGFTHQGAVYNLTVVSTLAKPNVQLPDFCLIYEGNFYEGS